ncbi:hypothetical protein ACU4GD_39640 [Cupriavidus basilensis]
MTAGGTKDINLNNKVTLSGAGNGLALNYGRSLNLNNARGGHLVRDGGVVQVERLFL